MTDKPDIEIGLNRDPDDRRGTSTSDDEAILRHISRVAFGITYPRDVTPPKRAIKRLPSRTP